MNDDQEQSAGRISNEADAVEMLQRLSDYYGVPVMPLPKFCAAVNLWFTVVAEAGTASYAEYLASIAIDISKSNLLGRLLYAGESLRTQLCPVHQGKWNGHAMLVGCEHECDGTGFLRGPNDRGGYTGNVRLVQSSISEPR